MKVSGKRVLSILLILMFTVGVFGFAPPAKAATSLDTASSWARDGIAEAISKGFVPTDLQKNYKSIINRQEFCRMAVKWLEYATNKPIDTILAERQLYRNPNAFSDTNDPDILAAFALGITSGVGNNRFNPSGQFNRQQAATMIMNTVRALGIDVSNYPPSGFADMSEASSWAHAGIDFVRARGIMQGIGNNKFSPLSPYTREQSIITFNNIVLAADTFYEFNPNNIRTDTQTQISYVNNIVLIFFKDNVPQQRKAEIVNSINGKVVGEFATINQYQVQISEKSFNELQRICEELSSLNDVLYATYDIAMKLDVTAPIKPDDPWNGNTWSENTPSGSNWWLEAIQAPSAWGYNDRLSRIKIGIVDDGFDTGHEDLKGSLSFPDAAYEFVNSKENHGTHVAGIIGAHENNQKGITGIVWDTELVCFDWEPTWLQEILTDWKTGTFIVAGLISTVKSGAKVVNFSVGCSSDLENDGKSFSQEWIDEFGKYASMYMACLLYQGYDFIVVQSAGNGASNRVGVDAINNGWFSSITRNNCFNVLKNVDDILNRIIIVGAAQQDGFSYVQPRFSNGGNQVDICAPGVDIYSTITGGFSGKYGNMSGTSMAAPIVTGVAGLVWSANPKLTGVEVKSIVCDRNNTIYNVADNDESPNALGTYRMVNAKLAVEAALGIDNLSPLERLVGTYRGKNLSHDGCSWEYTIDVYKSANETFEAIVDCYSDPAETYPSSVSPGPGAWRSSVDYDAVSNTYSVRFSEWIHNPGWATETFTNCVLSTDGNTLSGLSSADTWPGTKQYVLHRIFDSDKSFNNLRPIEQRGSIHFDQWDSSQHRGDFKDKEGKSFTGTGMYVSGGRSGAAYVKYLIPALSNRFTTFISLDSVWCGTEAYGTSTFQIFFDNELVFSKSYTETFSAELVDLTIPQNAKIITLQVRQNAGPSGNHACFFGQPTFSSK